MTADLVVDTVSKSWGGRLVLDSLRLRVDAGEIVAVLGQSGCGKTTLLRIIAGLEQPDAGSICIGGDDVTLARPARRGIGMVFQHHALLPHLSVAENIGFGLRTGRRRDPDAATKIERVTSLVGCGNFLDRPPPTLSGGERQRVALARALVRSPRLVLLDEPLSSLDAQDRAVLRTELRRSLVESGATAVHVTHDQTEAFAIGDRVAVVGDGVVQQIGTADDLYDAPATLSVASLVGAPRMNLYAVAPGGGATASGGGSYAGPFPVGLSDDLAVNGITAGVRARDVHLVTAGRSDAIGGVVVAVEIADDSATAHIDVDGHAVRVLVDRTTRPVVGERVAVAADPDRFHVFDTTTGMALSHPGSDRPA